MQRSLTFGLCQAAGREPGGGSTGGGGANAEPLLDEPQGGSAQGARAGIRQSARPLHRNARGFLGNQPYAELHRDGAGQEAEVYMNNAKKRTTPAS